MILIKAEFTEVLANIVESGIDIFNFDYTLYDPAYKETLEKKIIKHYYFSEIGQETVGRFINRLDTKLNEILPKYNLMYEAIAGGIDPLQQKKSTIIKDGTIIDDIDRSENTVLDDDTTNQVTTVVDSDQVDAITNSQKFSDTPQGRTDLSNTDYLTEITEEDNNVNTALDSTTTSNVAGTQDTTTTITGTEDQTRTVNETMTTSETDRTQAVLLEEFRQLYNDIDMLIIRDLGELFMQLY